MNEVKIRNLLKNLDTGQINTDMTNFDFMSTRSWTNKR